MRSKAKQRDKKRIKRIVLFSFLAVTVFVISLLLYYIIAGYSMYRSVIDKRDVFAEIEEIQSGESYITIDMLPSLYTDGVVAVEDIDFYSHKGLDYGAIIKAAWHNITTMSFSQGGSTITQQLAKNLFFTNEKKLERKVAEVFMVRLLEDNYSKEEILELYVNVIDFGVGYTGILEASLGYYGKMPNELTNEECAMLIGVPNAPLCYSPLIDPVGAEAKKEYVIQRLKDFGLWRDE